MMQGKREGSRKFWVKNNKDRTGCQKKKSEESSSSINAGKEEGKGLRRINKMKRKNIYSALEPPRPIRGRKWRHLQKQTLPPLSRRRTKNEKQLRKEKTSIGVVHYNRRRDAKKEKIETGKVKSVGGGRDLRKRINEKELRDALIFTTLKPVVCGKETEDQEVFQKRKRGIEGAGGKDKGA